MNEIVLESLPWIRAFGWSLLHFLWQGALVGAAFALLRALVPKRYCDLRYAIGLLALALLAVCPPLTLWLMRPQAGAAIVESLAPVQVAAGEAIAPVAAGPLADLAHAMPWLVLAWGIGVLAVAGRALHQWRALERIASQFAERHADLERMARHLARRFGFPGRVRVRVSASIDTPTLIGWFKPLVLLPTAIVLGFPRHQLELILAHELGHLRRYDHLVNLAQAVLETLLFYHPVVHWISREVRHEREVCCDRLVLRLTRGEPREYARTLAALEDLRQPSVLALAASGGMLMDRVRRIVGLPAPRLAPTRPVVGFWVIALASVALFATFALRLHQRGADAARAVIAALERLPRPDVATFADLTVRLSLEPIAGSRPHLAPLLPLVAPEPAATPAAERVVAPPSDPAPTIEAPLPQTMLPQTTLPPTITADTSALEVADLHVADAASSLPDEQAAPSASVAVSQAAPVRRPAPLLLRRVAPEFPDNVPANSRGHVEFEFTIAADGSVRNIQIVSGDEYGAFTVAARRALRQWRFAASAGGERYRQDFVFGAIDGEAEDESTCQKGTGSHICQPRRSAEPARSAATTASSTSFDPTQLLFRRSAGGGRGNG